MFWKTRYFLWREEWQVVEKFYRSSWRYTLIDLLLKTIYSLSNPYRICRKFLEKKGEENIYAYGETPITLWAEIAKLANLSRNDCFYDLGCGRGRVCFWTAHWIGCQTVGIDWVPTFIHRAQKISEHLRLKNLTFSEREMLSIDISKASVVYLYTFHPNEYVINFRSLAPNSRVITVSEPLTHPDFKISHTIQARFPWGSTDVYINLKN